MSYVNDRSWSDQYIDSIKSIIGPLLLTEAPLKEDTQEATDLMVFCARDVRIGARLRRSGYADKYGYEFTLRSRRHSGVETELSKIINGWGDWLFYGHAAGRGLSIDKWMIVDLNAFRAHLILHQERKHVVSKEMSNRDGVTEFRAYDVRSFTGSPKILVASG